MGREVLLSFSFLSRSRQRGGLWGVQPAVTLKTPAARHAFRQAGTGIPFQEHAK
jgi:hypothetical protein